MFQFLIGLVLGIALNGLFGGLVRAQECVQCRRMRHKVLETMREARP